MDASSAINDIKKIGDNKRAQHAHNYFKAGKGGYGAGDQFIGVRVPEVRKLARHYKDLDLTQIKTLLHSPIHEVRLLALIIMVNQFKHTQRHQRQAMMQHLFQFYIENTNAINNWDLVDVSCRDIVGGYLLNQPAKKRTLLYDWARSDHLWQKRMAIISTWTFIRHQQLDDTINIATLLIADPHDLIHKAVGWMLRELGAKDESKLLGFLHKHARQMPRTMLRYAIEKLPQQTRQHWLSSTR